MPSLAHVQSRRFPRSIDPRMVPGVKARLVAKPAQRNAREPDMDLSAASARQWQRASRSPRELSSVMPPLAALRTAASTARAHVRSTLAMWEMSHLSDTVEIIVNELVANAVNASTDGQGRPLYRDGRILVIWVRLSSDNARLRAEVWDQAPGAPALRDADANAESGRGLAMVTALSDEWNWYPSRGQPGKCIWADISITSLPLSTSTRRSRWQCHAYCRKQRTVRSRAKGSPVTHDHHKTISLDAPQRCNHRSSCHPILGGQRRHRWQPLLRLPFTTIDSHP